MAKVLANPMPKNNLSLKTAGAALLSLLLLTISPAFAGDQDFTLHNRTGVEIHELYVSPHSADNWEEDILGKDTLATDDDLEIKFSPKENAELWDLKIVDGKGNPVVFEKLKLTEITDVTLKIEDGDPVAYTKNGDN